MKVVKSDWDSKLSEENIEALLSIKLEHPEIEEFIKEHSSDARMFWWNAKEQIKGGNGQPQDLKILGWCPAGPVLPHGEKVPL